MDAPGLRRLEAEQRKALISTLAQLEKWTKFKEDYLSLKNKLEELPDCVSYDIMVPFGKLAFMPGQLVHCNEILVLLGDNWFAEKSAKEACQVIERRLKEIEQTIAQLKAQKDLLESRRVFTDMTLDELSGKAAADLQEEYHSDEEQQWREKHRASVKKHKAAEKLARDNMQEDTFAKLEKLELQERKRGELVGANNEKLDSSGTVLQKGVKWEDESQPEMSLEANSSSSLDSDDSDTPPSVITFQHSPSEPQAVQLQNVSKTIEGIQSPADIHRLFSKPKSILKQPITSTQHQLTEPEEKDGVEKLGAKTVGNPCALERPSNTEAPVAEHIVERPINVQISVPRVVQQKSAEPNTSTQSPRLSKFKAMRMYNPSEK